MIADIALVFGVPLVAASLDSWWQKRKRPPAAPANPPRPSPEAPRNHDSLTSDVCQLGLQVGFLLEEVRYLRSKIEPRVSELEAAQ